MLLDQYASESRTSTFRMTADQRKALYEAFRRFTKREGYMLGVSDIVHAAAHKFCEQEGVTYPPTKSRGGGSHNREDG